MNRILEYLETQRKMLDRIIFLSSLSAVVCFGTALILWLIK
jgi:cytochrome bd-type quinol oxidase subunit 2